MSGPIAPVRPACGGRWIGPVALLAMALALGGALRAAQLSARPLGFDEAFSWRVSRYPLPDLLRLVAGDNHPPLHFLLLKGWMSLLGETEFALRSLSLLFGELSILFGYLLAMELAAWRRQDFSTSSMAPAAARGKSWMPTFVAWGMAVSPADIRWSGCARMYAPGVCLALLSTLALVHALRAPSFSWRKWSLYALAALAFLYTHYFALFTIAAQLGFVAAYSVWKATCPKEMLLAVAGRIVWPLAVIAVGSSPWLPAFLQQQRQVRDAFWINPVATREAVNMAYQLLVEPRNGAYCEPGVALAVAVGYLAVLLASVARPARERWLVLVLIAGPPLMVALLSLAGWIHLFHWWYFSFSHAFFWLAAAHAVSVIPDGSIRAIVAIGMVGAGLSASLQFLDHLDVPARQGLRATMASVAREGPDEPVFIGIPELYHPAWYYAPDRSLVRLYYRSGQVPHYYGSSVIDPSEVLNAAGVAELVAGERRFWVIDPGRDVLTAQIGSDWRAVLEQREFDLFTNLEVVLRRFERVDAPSAADAAEKQKNIAGGIAAPKSDGPESGSPESDSNVAGGVGDV